MVWTETFYIYSLLSVEFSLTTEFSRYSEEIVLAFRGMSYGKAVQMVACSGLFAAPGLPSICCCPLAGVFGLHLPSSHFCFLSSPQGTAWFSMALHTVLGESTLWGTCRGRHNRWRAGSDRLGVPMWGPLWCTLLQPTGCVAPAGATCLACKYWPLRLWIAQRCGKISGFTNSNLF